MHADDTDQGLAADMSGSPVGAGRRLPKAGVGGSSRTPETQAARIKNPLVFPEFGSIHTAKRGRPDRTRDCNPRHPRKSVARP